MKEMVYSKMRNVEILDRGIYKDYDYVILSLGTHPCAYVRIPEDHPYYGKDYNNCDIDCHWGLTYGSPYLRTSNDTQEIGWWIGWDYAHSGDYMDYGYEIGMNDGDKKWTTDEIVRECKRVINQIIKLEKEVIK